MQAKEYNIGQLPADVMIPRENEEKNIRERLMPSGCKSGIDLIHLDKGKVLTMGKFPDDKGKLKDQVCLLAKNADYPYDSLEVKVGGDFNNVDFFAVTHHGLPIRIHPWVAMGGILYALPAQEGMRFDVGFKNDAKCDFTPSDPPYDVPTPEREGVNEASKARHAVIECKGSSTPDSLKTADYVDRAEQVMGKEVTRITRHGSVLKEFIDAKKWDNANNTRAYFKNGGKLTFTPNYFTESWFMIRSGGQMKKKDVYLDRKSLSGIGAKIDRLEREIDYLFDGGEWKTLVDFSGDDVKIGKPIDDRNAIAGDDVVGKDPNTYVIHKAFVDPAVMSDISMKSPRDGKVKTATVTVKPGTTCEIRTNFKRRPVTMIENLLFCTNLDGDKIDWKAAEFINGFEDRLESLEKASKMK